MDRTVVIINKHDEFTSNVLNIVNIFMTNVIASKIIVFTNKPDGNFNTAHERCTCVNEVIPAELDSEPKIRNWINKKYSDYNGFLHVISDNVQILKDPAKFIDDIEKMMSVLDYNVWFSTISDPCNYVYSKYNPRITIAMNEARSNAKYNFTSDICITSHSNTAWVIYNCSQLHNTDLMQFDEKYTIDMFYIIEFLARRRNTKSAGSIYFMNQYFTVGSEQGVFKVLSSNSATDQKNMADEDKIFKAANINYQPDMSMDTLLETFWEKLESKLG